MRILSKLFIGSISGIIFSSMVFLFLTNNDSESYQNIIFPVKVGLPDTGQEIFELPVRIKIPKIDIDANIEYVGITSLGLMDVPKGPADVAWFNLGPRPGEIGSSVMAGHSGWKNNIPAVFDNLYKLQKGDKIYVEDDKGAIITFVVRESKKYNPNGDASDVFSSNDEQAHLNLVTCTGIWNNVKKSRSDRLVVFTDRELTN